MAELIKETIDGIDLEMTIPEALGMAARLLDLAEIALFEGRFIDAMTQASSANKLATQALGLAKAAGNEDQAAWARVTMRYANSLDAQASNLIE